MKKPGRPHGSTQYDEKKSKNITISATPTAYKYFQSKPKGWLSDWLETQARTISS